MSEHESVHDLSQFFNAHDKVAWRRAECEAAGAKLDLEQIKERMWELRSQHEPLNKLTDGDLEQRDRILQAIFYVVIGRFPSKQ